MASRETEETLSFTLSETIESLLESYQQMRIPLERYVVYVLLPASVFFVLSVLAASLIDLPLPLSIPIPLLGFLALLAALFYPKILISQRRQQLNNRFHLLVTHMTVLATTKIDRMEVFRTLAREEEYGELANEMYRITQLVDTWNQSLDDACRRRAKEIPSRPVSDFLDRLAYTIGAGQSLDEYLIGEQEQVIKTYQTVYEGTLDNLEVMKDLYLSMVLSMTFALVFAVVLPVLTGTDPMMTVSAVIVMYVFVQSGFYLAIRSMAPYDPVWYHPETNPSPVDKPIDRATYVALALCGVFTFVTIGGLFGFSPVSLDDVLFFLDEVPLPLYAVVPVTPLLIPGIVLRRAEQRIKGRDDEFPSFIRALGATEGAKQSTTSKVLKSLRKKDFGPLTSNIDGLYKRLNMRIEPAAAWRYFTADCRSYLIQTFSEMYLVGRAMGGSPKLLGELIAENMNVVGQLRTQRQQATTTLIGLLYGITAASTFAFFIGLQVVAILESMTINLESNGAFDASTLIHTGVYDIPVIEFLLIVVIMFSAMLSALMIRTVDGGHKVNTYVHFVLLSWVGALIAIGTRWMVNQFLVI